MGKGDAPKRRDVDPETIAGNTRKAKRARNDTNFQELGKGDIPTERQQQLREVMLSNEARLERDKRIDEAKTSRTIKDQSTFQTLMSETAAKAMNFGEPPQVDSDSSVAAPQPIYTNTLTNEPLGTVIEEYFASPVSSFSESRSHRNTGAFENTVTPQEFKTSLDGFHQKTQELLKSVERDWVKFQAIYDIEQAKTTFTQSLTNHKESLKECLDDAVEHRKTFEKFNENVYHGTFKNALILYKGSHFPYFEKNLKKVYEQIDSKIKEFNGSNEPLYALKKSGQEYWKDIHEDTKLLLKSGEIIKEHINKLE